MLKAPPELGDSTQRYGRAPSSPSLIDSAAP